MQTMRMTRRTLEKTLAGMAVCVLGAENASRAQTDSEQIALPARLEFSADQFQVSLNNARWHPLSRGAQAAMNNYIEYKLRGIWQPDDMLSAMQSSFPAFRRYLKAKAARLGKPALPWYDLFAPLPHTGEAVHQKLSWRQAREFVNLTRP